MDINRTRHIVSICLLSGMMERLAGVTGRHMEDGALINEKFLQLGGMMTYKFFTKKKLFNIFKVYI